MGFPMGGGSTVKGGGPNFQSGLRLPPGGSTGVNLNPPQNSWVGNQFMMPDLHGTTPIMGQRPMPPSGGHGLPSWLQGGFQGGGMQGIMGLLQKLLSSFSPSSAGGGSTGGLGGIFDALGKMGG